MASIQRRNKIRKCTVFRFDYTRWFVLLGLNGKNLLEQVHIFKIYRLIESRHSARKIEKMVQLQMGLRCLEK